MSLRREWVLSECGARLLHLNDLLDPLLVMSELPSKRGVNSLFRNRPQTHALAPCTISSQAHTFG